MANAFRTVVLMMLVLFSTAIFAVSPTPFTIVKDPINVSDYKGKWILISYWATWCNICMEEIPDLNAFYRAHRNEVVMFGVNYEDGPLKDLPQRIQESGVAFPTFAYDPKGRFGVGKIRGLPATLLIGPDGQLKRILMGSQTKRDLENAVGLR